MLMQTYGHIHTDATFSMKKFHEAPTTVSENAMKTIVLLLIHNSRKMEKCCFAQRFSLNRAMMGSRSTDSHCSAMPGMASTSSMIRFCRWPVR